MADRKRLLQMDAPQVQYGTSEGSQAPDSALRNVIDATSQQNQSGADPENDADERHGPEFSEPAESGLKAVIRWLNPELANTGSVARDHLANERTVLAWLRSSLSLAAIGIAIAQLFRLSAVYANPSVNTATASTDAFRLPPGVSTTEGLDMLIAQLNQHGNSLAQLLAATAQADSSFSKLGKPIGGLFIAASIVLLVLGTLRYFHVQMALQQGVFPPARKSVMISSVLVVSLIIASFAVILAFR